MRLPYLERTALVPLRLAIGAGLFAHGYAKLAHGPEHFAKIVAALGFPAPITMSAIVIAIELATGVAFLLGAFVRPAALAAAPVIAVATAGVHLRYGFLAVRLVELGPDGAKFGPVGYELGLIYLAALAALALAAPTPWSIDAWRTSRRTRRSPGDSAS
jgi:putative oxidoreductase